MSSCTSIDPLVTRYVDGELTPADRALVDDHLRRCPPCQGRVSAESAGRELLRAHRSRFVAERAPMDLHARCARLAEESRLAAAPPVPASTPRRARRSWLSPLAPMALAASLVILVGGAFVYQATGRSSRVMAAELAAGHVMCFAVNDLLGVHGN